MEENEDNSVIMPSLTYKVENGRILGKIDYLEAVKQAVYKILATERFIYEIYSWQYGNDLNVLFGKEILYAETDVRRILEEALLADERVDSVVIEEVKQVGKSGLFVHLTVNTLFGNFKVEKEVKV